MKTSLFFLLSCLFISPTWAQDQASCSEVPDYDDIRFLEGDWRIFYSSEAYAKGQRHRVGVNRFRKTATSCAFTEHWMSMAGTEGKSLLFFSEADSVWKQVGVSQSSEVDPGEVYEKTLIEKGTDGWIRFQGMVTSSTGEHSLERTSYKPLPDGAVQFLLESSHDEGATWETNIDAVYGKEECAKL